MFIREMLTNLQNLGEEERIVSKEEMKCNGEGCEQRKGGQEFKHNIPLLL